MWTLAMNVKKIFNSYPTIIDFQLKNLQSLEFDLEIAIISDYLIGSNGGSSSNRLSGPPVRFGSF
ncbi:hypothetical protein ACJIZ3_009421 [Penstemon smallii]|uniref:Maturase K n=1 Tax=Penstemon smallii TaxID=265156 RepID=A0ABD3TDY1_9LAMI